MCYREITYAPARLAQRISWGAWYKLSAYIQLKAEP